VSTLPSSEVHGRYGRGRGTAVPDTRSPSTARFSYSVAFLHRTLRRSLQQTLEPHGLTVAQYTVLSLLGRRDGLSNAQLARRAHTTPQAMNEVMRSLEQQRLVERRPSAEHARIQPARLTRQGRSRLRRCDADVDDMEAALLGSLEPEERDELTALLMGLARLLADAE